MEVIIKKHYQKLHTDSNTVYVDCLHLFYYIFSHQKLLYNLIILKELYVSLSDHNTKVLKPNICALSVIKGFTYLLIYKVLKHTRPYYVGFIRFTYLLIYKVLKLSIGLSFKNLSFTYLLIYKVLKQAESIEKCNL